MKLSFSELTATVRRIPPWGIGGVLFALALTTAWLSADWWLPHVRQWIAAPAVQAAANDDDTDHHTERDSDSVRLSQQARRTLGLTVGDVQLQRFSRTIGIPAMVVEHPGRTHINVSAPMTGVITRVAVIRGQATRPGDVLFHLRLLHEDLVRAQTDFLRTLGQLEVEEKEIARLKNIAGGGVAERLILERQYERDKLQAVLRAQEEALLLHGLNREQVTTIKTKGRLAREIVVRVPGVSDDGSLPDTDSPDSRTLTEDSSNRRGSPSEAPRRQLIVEQLPVHVGQAVKTGDPLCVLADYRTLHIEGRAFEQDAEALIRAANQHHPVTAIPKTRGDATAIQELEIVHIGNVVDPESRALDFHVLLHNTVVRDVMHHGRRFLTWKYKPGQRMQLRVPVEVWENVIVLPIDAVARDGPETFVFVENGSVFERRPVTVVYRDPFNVLMAYDGSLAPGERVALNSAHQLLLALKKQAGDSAAAHHHHH